MPVCFSACDLIFSTLNSILIGYLKVQLDDKFLPETITVPTKSWLFKFCTFITSADLLYMYTVIYLCTLHNLCSQSSRSVNTYVLYVQCTIFYSNLFNVTSFQCNLSKNIFQVSWCNDFVIPIYIFIITIIHVPW